MSQRLEQIAADHDQAIAKVKEAQAKNWEGMSVDESNALIQAARDIKAAYDLEVSADEASQALPNIETESEKLATNLVKEQAEAGAATVSVDEETARIKEARNAFREWMINPGSIKNLAEYDAQNQLSRGVNDEGGYGIRTDIQREVIQKMVMTGSVRSLARVITVEDGVPRRWVTSDNNDLKATFQPQENYNASDRSDIELDRVEFDFDRLDTDVIPVSYDLIKDASFDPVAYVTDTIARLFSVAQEEAFVQGISTSGIHIQGIVERVPSAQRISSTTSGASTVTNATLTIDNCIDVLYAIDPAYGDNAVFLISKATLPVLLKAKDNDGRFLLQPNAQLGNPGVLHGKEVYLHRFVDDIGASNTPLICGDMQNYVIMDIANELDVAIYTDSNYARKRQIGYHGSTRLAANVLQPAAFSRLDQPA